MKDDTFHMGVVEIQNVAHLSVDEGGFRQSDLASVGDDRHAFEAAHGRDACKRPGDRRMTAARDRAAQPIENAAPAFVHDIGRKILEIQARRECAELTAHAELQRRYAVLNLAGARHVSFRP